MKVHDSLLEATINILLTYPRRATSSRRDGVASPRTTRSSLSWCAGSSCLLPGRWRSASTRFEEVPSCSFLLERRRRDHAALGGWRRFVPRGGHSATHRALPRFMQRVETVLAPDEVNSYQAYTLCTNLLTSVCGNRAGQCVHAHCCWCCAHGAGFG